MASTTTTKPYPPIVQAIMDGEHDEILGFIASACAARTKNMWRKGMRIRLEGTKNPTLDGQEGVIVKVNSKTVSVGIGEATTDQWGTSYALGEYNVTPNYLRKV